MSPCGLINDAARHVRVFIDKDFKTAMRVSFHPNDNTMTIVVTFADFRGVFWPTAATR